MAPPFEIFAPIVPAAHSFAFPVDIPIYAGRAKSVGLTLPPLSTKVGALSGGQRQAVAIARAVLWGSKIVMLDEPTAALGAKQIEIVLTFVKRLKEHGVAVVYISHNMQHVLRVADRVVVLRLGHKVFDGERTNLTGPQLVGLMTGALVEETAPAA